MPSSDPMMISRIVQIVQAINPQSILDVGVGCGKYGMLFREYLDGHWTKSAFHDQSTWKRLIIGMEVHKEYITPVHDYLYDEILICDAFDWFMNQAGKFDMIFMGDVIEHFPMVDGVRLLQKIHADWLNPNGHILITTPNFKTQINNESLAVFGNKHEVHRCRWGAKDFLDLFPTANIEEGKHILADIIK